VSFLLGLACLITAIFPTQKGTCLRVPTAESARAIGGSGLSGQEVMLSVLAATNGNVQSLALLITPETAKGYALGHSPTITSQYMEAFATMMSEQGIGLLNRLGIFMPMFSYEQLDGVNACIDFGTRHLRLVDVPGVEGHSRNVYLLVRSSLSGQSPAPSLPPGPNASAGGSMAPFGECPPTGAYADFAPPIETAYDPEVGCLALIPKTTIRFNDGTWDHDFIGAVFPTPSGKTLYRHPDANGRALFSTTNPFKPDFNIDIAGVDPMAFAGLSEALGLPRGGQLLLLLSTIVTRDQGQGLYFWDGEQFKCEWTGGSSAPALLGVVRKTVKVTCTTQSL
jgi:hypothetical protein